MPTVQARKKGLPTMAAKYRVGVIASGRIAREHTEIAASAGNILLTSVEKTILL